MAPVEPMAPLPAFAVPFMQEVPHLLDHRRRLSGNEMASLREKIMGVMRNVNQMREADRDALYVEHPDFYRIYSQSVRFISFLD
jgi:hypothetical protein